MTSIPTPAVLIDWPVWATQGAGGSFNISYSTLIAVPKTTTKNTTTTTVLSRTTTVIKDATTTEYFTDFTPVEFTSTSTYGTIDWWGVFANTWTHYLVTAEVLPTLGEVRSIVSYDYLETTTYSTLSWTYDVQSESTPSLTTMPGYPWSPATTSDTVSAKGMPTSRSTSGLSPGVASHSSSDLSPGAKAGIGVGVAAGVILIACLGFLLGRKRAMTESIPRSEREIHSQGPSNEIHGEETQEMQVDSNVSELGYDRRT